MMGGNWVGSVFSRVLRYRLVIVYYSVLYNAL